MATLDGASVFEHQPKMQKRRSPRRPASKGIELKGTDKQIAVLDALQHFTLLPSNYISKWIGYSHKANQQLFTELHGEGFIEVPDEANAHFNAINRPAIYTLTQKGKDLLKEHGQRRPSPKLSGNWFRHRFLASIVQFSFEIAPREIEGLRFISSQDILSKSPKKTRDSSRPWVIPTEPILVPDASPFGFEYGGTFMFFHGFEADRANQPRTSSNNERQTIASKIERYAQYLSERMYQEMYGLKACSILIATTGPASRWLNEISAYPEKVQKRIAVKQVPDFLSKTIPEPTAWIVREPWTTTVGPLDIMEVLSGHRKTGKPHPKEESDRRGDSGSGGREEAGA